MNQEQFIQNLLKEERVRLINEYNRLSKISPDAMIIINNKYKKNITEYDSGIIRDIIVEILNYNYNNSN